jgi:hypothetical protein
MSTTLLPRPTREEVIDAILKANPGLKLGADFTSPVMKISDGQPSEIGKEIYAGSVMVRLPLTDQTFAGLVTDEQYVHFYNFGDYNFPNPNVKVGDVVKGIDPNTFEPTEREVTQADMNLWNRFVVRLAVS